MYNTQVKTGAFGEAVQIPIIDILACWLYRLNILRRQNIQVCTELGNL